MIRAFIFDLDGVITDTAEYHYRGWKRLAEEEDLSFTREDNEHLRGVARRESLMLILKDRLYPEEKILEMMERKNDYYLAFIKEITPQDLLPGAKEVLEEIRAAGLKNALGSASKNAAEVIERLGIRDLFDAVSDGSAWNDKSPRRICFFTQRHSSDFPLLNVWSSKMPPQGSKPRERVGQADTVFQSLEGVRLANLYEALQITPE